MKLEFAEILKITAFFCYDTNFRSFLNILTEVNFVFNFYPLLCLNVNKKNSY